eukprot:6186741-Pleurochrysis_carterae.AAC.2
MRCAVRARVPRQLRDGGEGVEAESLPASSPPPSNAFSTQTLQLPHPPQLLFACVSVSLYPSLPGSSPSPSCFLLNRLREQQSARAPRSPPPSPHYQIRAHARRQLNSTPSPMRIHIHAHAHAPP